MAERPATEWRVEDDGVTPAGIDRAVLLRDGQTCVYVFGSVNIAVLRELVALAEEAVANRPLIDAAREYWACYRSPYGMGLEAAERKVLRVVRDRFVAEQELAGEGT